MQQHGFLVISDITGYTAYLTGTEQLHAEEILQDLFKMLLEHTAPPLVVNKLEGDAILSYAPAESFSEGQSLLESVENTYVKFRLLRENIHRHTSCECRACSNIENLDLKFFVHYGDFSLLEIGGREELSGPNVILIHRLLKNRVSVPAYGLYTAAAAEALGLREYFDAHMTTHVEQYDHLGAVNCYVQDMSDVWMTHQGHRRLFVGEGDAGAFDPVETTIATSAGTVWEFLSQPKTFPQWYSGVESTTVTGTDEGRSQRGTVGHCTHGKQSFTLEIVDFSPLDYVTYEVTVPMPMMGAMRMHFTYQVSQVPAGTRVVAAVSEIHFQGSRIQSALASGMFKLMSGRMKRQMRSDFQDSLDALRDLIDREIANESIAPGAPVLGPEEIDETLQQLLQEDTQQPEPEPVTSED